MLCQDHFCFLLITFLRAPCDEAHNSSSGWVAVFVEDSTEAFDGFTNLPGVHQDAVQVGGGFVPFNVPAWDATQLEVKLDLLLDFC